MPSISKQPILNSVNFGDFGSISNEAPANLKEYEGFERINWSEKFG